MTEVAAVSGFFNRYSMVARYYPALLAIAPLIWSSAVLMPDLFSHYRKWTGSIIVLSATLYLIGSLARSRGKFIEKRLIQRWGGWPTTIVLRHRNSVVDPVTKARYHRSLAAISGIQSLPAPMEEAADPTMADDLYRSATKRLIELRRGRAFRMLEDENASYGFRRNLLGLKWTAVCIALVAAGATAIVWWGSFSRPSELTTLVQALGAGAPFPALFCVDLIYAATIIFAVTHRFVEQAAYEYAAALFRTLDQ
ncbi:MAG TPA: hypothetical protein VMU40_03495 [Steroidobacteraceae bacterium]|nr:hypothetical protein [Steroidobacteraceae bacterium]